MAKYKQYDYKQMVILPIFLENQLTPGTLAFAIHYLVKTRMDLSVFDEKYKNDETGRLAYDPKILLKVVLFAYSRGQIGSCKIEQACRLRQRAVANGIALLSDGLIDRLGCYLYFTTDGGGFTFVINNLYSPTPFEASDSYQDHGFT